MRLVLLATVVACWASAAASPVAHAATGWDGARIDSLAAVMPALLQEFDVPGVSIALIAGPEVQWSAGFGQAGRAGSDVTPQTVFQVASLAKPVFAHLLDGIETARAWELRDPLQAWSPGDAYPPALGILAAEDLLGHTSGLRYDAVQDRVVLDSAGRGQWSYSGAGYVLLQRALEAAEGQSLEELSGAMIFGPLGLRTMSYVRLEGGQHAVGHDRSGKPLTDLDWEEANAGSSLYASALDYARFLIFAAGLDGSDRAPWIRLTRDRVAVDERLGLYWGLGWAVERDVNGHRTGFHWGSNPGFKSFALLDPERQMGMVILTNGDHGLELVQRVVGILDPKPHPLFDFYMLHPDD